MMVVNGENMDKKEQKGIRAPEHTIDALSLHPAL